jgi:hypothetical protein
MSRASDQVSNDEVPIPCLRIPATPRPSDPAAAALRTDKDDEVPFLSGTHRPALAYINRGRWER